MDLSTLANLIAGNQWKAVTQQYRALSNSATKGKFKTTRFDFATFSGTFSQRNNYSLNSYSGLLVLDIDNVRDIDIAKEVLLTQLHFDIAMLYVSPGGRGLKLIAPATTEDEHHLVYQMYQGFLEEELGIEIDTSGKDIARSCFLCWDPEVYFNPDFSFRKIEKYWNPQPALAPKRSDQTRDLYCSPDTDLSPIIDFNKRGDIGEILLKHKWTEHSKYGDRIFYTRPNKNKYEGQSANVSISRNYFYNFTSSPYSQFAPNRGYTPSQVFAVLECARDMKVANEKLKDLGYGNQGNS